MGNKEKLIEILKESKLGLSYKELLKKFKDRYNQKIHPKELYYYISKLRKEGILETEKSAKLDGKALVYVLKEQKKEMKETINHDREKLLSLINDGILAINPKKIKGKEEIIKCLESLS